jgi:hypothetical protein
MLPAGALVAAAVQPSNLGMLWNILTQHALEAPSPLELCLSKTEKLDPKAHSVPKNLSRMVFTRRSAKHRENLPRLVREPGLTINSVFDVISVFEDFLRR